MDSSGSASALRVPVSESPALFFYGTRISFQELNELSTRFALGLRRLGVETGDRVALMLPNIPQAVIAYYGVLKAGAVVTPTNPLYVERVVRASCMMPAAIPLSHWICFILASRLYVNTGLPHRIILTSLRDFLPP